eukprot:551461_1
MASRPYKMGKILKQTLEETGSYDMLYDILCDLEATTDMLTTDVDIDEFCRENDLKKYKQKLHVKKLIRILKEKKAVDDQKTDDEEEIDLDDEDKKAMEIKNMQTDYSMKLLIIGDSGTGKTTLLTRYMKNAFLEYGSTFGIDQRYALATTANGKKMKLHIVDCGGQDRYQKLTRSAYRETDVALLCYAVNDLNSFQNAQKWRQQVKEDAPDDCIIILVGCKCDITQRPAELSTQNIEATIKKDNVWKQYLNFNDQWLVECSSKTGHNVNSIFHSAVQMMVTKQEKDKKKRLDQERKRIKQQEEMTRLFTKSSSEVSSEVEAKKKCFASDSFAIIYPDYEEKCVSDLTVDDRVLSYDPIHQQYVWEQIVVKRHFDKDEYLCENVIEMIEFVLTDKQKLAMTSNHLLYVNGHIKRADQVKIGDKLNHFKLNKCEVISVSKVMKYARNIWTFNGNLVINGFAISCFCDTVNVKHLYFLNTLRYILNNYSHYNAVRYPMYYLCNLWGKYL